VSDNSSLQYDLPVTLVKYVSVALFVASCATPVPLRGDFYHEVPRSEIGLAVDLDLLATANLAQDKKRIGEELLSIFHTAETSFENYIGALDTNIAANEEIKEQYAISEAVIGGLTGIASPAIIFATAAVAIPIAGAIWIALGETIQRFDVKPKIDEANHSVDEARRITRLFPDIITAFRGLVFSSSETEADRRFMLWQAYIENLRKKSTEYFTKK
jgi:hypothetical protein